MAEFESWSREQLIEHIAALEVKKNKGKQVAHTNDVSPDKQERMFNFNSYAQRKIALKFCYHGWDYNGLAFQVTPTPLPTVEGVLFDALCRARLIDRDAGFEGCDWSRCGRTDRGVSSAGQVIALKVRCSLRPKVSKEASLNEEEDVQKEEEKEGQEQGQKEKEKEQEQGKREGQGQEPPIEILYTQVLNRILPPTIRIIAWAPVREDFSARFHCRYRHYKYFFESLLPPARPLDIPRMQEAAARLVGEHDFRHFCKLDGSKQIERYERRVTSATISEVVPSRSGSEKPLYVFDLIGSAFLWHQVRHIVAILFLVGQGFEEVDIIDALLNANASHPNPDPSVPFLERRPLYDMVEGLPLVLWKCGFDEKDVKWRTDDYDGEEVVVPSLMPSTIQLRESMESALAASRIKTSLLEHFLQTAAEHHPTPAVGADKVVRVHAGGGRIRHFNKYEPLLKRKRGPTVTDVNETWKNGRGPMVAARRAAKISAAGRMEEEEGPE
ncbi:hypothetical protein FRC14_007013 [Serendipita sp. 396]|nr:hypothetical protein FRC14_007013 [Serendipita sp. 396]